MTDRQKTDHVPGNPAESTAPSTLRAVLHKAVPSHFNDPFGLAARIMRSGSRDGRAALVQAGLKLGLLPLDLVLSMLPGGTSQTDAAPARPIVFVTGPPRSGTTLLHQLLIRSLPVAYLTNLASLLPRSALGGGFALTRAIANDRVLLESYYGRTRALTGPSDGLEFWDRWLGADRRHIPDRIQPPAAAEMRRFFAALERQTGRPIVAKNNNLLGSAHLVAEVLPAARFVCLARDPLYLAQSLLKARRDIHGDTAQSYGIERDGAAALTDPAEDVWRQVGFYQSLQAAQTRRLGPDRFLTIRYEALCDDPAAVVGRIARDLLGLDVTLPPMAKLNASKDRKLDPDLFDRLAAAQRKVPPG